MADHFSNLVAASLGTAQVIQPRVSSRFQSEFIEPSNMTWLAQSAFPTETLQTSSPQPANPIALQTTVPSPEIVTSPVINNSRMRIGSLPNLVAPEAPRTDKPVSLFRDLARRQIPAQPQTESEPNLAFETATPTPSASNPRHALPQIDPDTMLSKNATAMPLSQMSRQVDFDLSEFGEKTITSVSERTPSQSKAESDDTSYVVTSAQPITKSRHVSYSADQARTNAEILPNSKPFAAVTTIDETHEPRIPQPNPTFETVSQSKPIPARSTQSISPRWTRAKDRLNDNPQLPLSSERIDSGQSAQPLARSKATSTNPTVLPVPPLQKSAPNRTDRLVQSTASDNEIASELIARAPAPQFAHGQSTIINNDRRQTNYIAHPQATPLVTRSSQVEQPITNANRPASRLEIAEDNLASPQGDQDTISTVRQNNSIRSEIPAVSAIRPRIQSVLETQVSSVPRDQRTVAESEPAPVIRVSIGRVEVRGNLPSTTPSAKRAITRPVLSLDDYLKQIKGNTR